MELHGAEHQRQGSSYFFANFDGYDDLQAEEGATPKAQVMSGLSAEDDTTIKVTLASPFRQFPLVVGYSAFFPLPDSFYDDPEAFGKQPIGNGPFKADEPFVDGQGITLTRYEDYQGDDKAKAGSVQYKVYTELNTAYNDVQGGALDITSDIPPDAITSAQDVFGDRYIERPSSSFTYVGFPTYDPRYADKRVRQALSMAIDRKAITDAIFNGTREPAYSVISPVVDGARDDACEYCKLNVDEANKLLDEAGFDRSKPVELWFNAGAGHDEWMQAVGQQLRDNLQLDFKLNGNLQFSEYLPKGDAKGFTGPFRLGWAMDYPSPAELPRAVVRHVGAPAGRQQLGVLLEPRVRQADSRRQLGRFQRRGHRGVPEGGGRAAGGHAGHADVLRPGPGRVLRQGEQRQDRRLHPGRHPERGRQQLTRPRTR